MRVNEVVARISKDETITIYDKNGSLTLQGNKGDIRRLEEYGYYHVGNWIVTNIGIIHNEDKPSLYIETELLI